MAGPTCRPQCRLPPPFRMLLCDSATFPGQLLQQRGCATAFGGHAAVAPCARATRCSTSWGVRKLWTSSTRGELRDTTVTLGCLVARSNTCGWVFNLLMPQSEPLLCRQVAERRPARLCGRCPTGAPVARPAASMVASGMPQPREPDHLQAAGPPAFHRAHLSGQCPASTQLSF